jgi:cysteine desulfurase
VTSTCGSNALNEIYLDNAATTRMAPEVRDAMIPWLGELWGNPSSKHRLGIQAREAIDRARDQVARAVDARARGVHFTSGGTEANNLAVQSAARMRASKGKHILIGPTEHPSVREAALSLTSEGFTVVTLRLDSSGDLDLQHAASALRPDTVLVAQMLVSNELGTHYPVAALAKLTRGAAPHAHVHVDAVQGLGKVEVSLADLGADSLAVSAHKLHGPQGCGALVLAEGVELKPIVHGGGQENGLRQGTQGVPGIVGFGAAAQLADRHLAESRTTCERVGQILIAGTRDLRGVVPVTPGTTVPNILSLELPGAPAEVWLHHLEERGIYVSVGSACHSNKGGENSALGAIGFDNNRAKQVMRMSFCRDSTEEEATRVVEVMLEIARELENL